ncbi:MAG: DsrE family protein [Chloroflexi bacterium]|nr:DsrE family protein [Chloroflexota bacterium]
MDVVSEMLPDDIEVRFIPLYSPEANARGAEIAPTLVVNGKRLVEGIPTPAEIVQLVEEARPITLGIILTKAPGGNEDAEIALDTALAALAQGNKASLFLLGDGAWVAKNGQAGPAAAKLRDLLSQGGEVTLDREHLKATGLTTEKLLPGVKVAADGLGELVDMAMSRWDKVITF